MSFVDYIKKGWEVIQLKTDAVKELAADEKGIGPAIGILAIAGACAGIGALNFVMVIGFAIGWLIWGFVFVAITHFAATTFFGGKGKLTSLVVPVFCGSLVLWVSIVPVLGPMFLSFLASLWMLVITVVCVENVYEGVDRGKAIASVAIPVVLSLILGVILAVVGVGLLAATGAIAN